MVAKLKPAQPGQVYNRWTVIGTPFYKRRWLKVECKCECGKVKNVDHAALQSGHSKSCGCLRSEMNKERANEQKRKVGLGYP